MGNTGEVCRGRCGYLGSRLPFRAEKPDTLSVEQCISKGVFGSERNVFADFRKEAATVQTGESPLIMAANERLKKKIPVMDFNF